MSAEGMHLHQLAEVVGPRPATTDAEARAADYIAGVFRARGLEVERQEFLTPRTYAWSFVAYHLMTVAAALAAGVPVLRWPALGLAVVSAVVMWMELDTRWGLIDLMPKGPSQNVIARYVPKARRGERVRRVVVVAHYDSARSSIAFSPGMVKNFSVSFGLMKWITLLMPVLVLASALPFTAPLQPWLWYATLTAAAYLVFPLLVNVHRELFGRTVDGANDNASGVAAMLGVMERVTPEVEGYEPPAAEPALAESDWVEPEPPEGMSYVPAEPDAAVLPADDFDTEISWGASASAGQGQAVFDLEETGGQAGPEEGDSVAGWLGVNDGFDARKQGRRIGSWDNFEDADDPDGMGWKGGAPPFDDLDDPGFAAAEAARIRRRVTERPGREAADKEVWFVATGAEEVGTRGMRAFLDEYSEDLRDAMIVNIDGVGVGNVHWVTAEGMARRYHSDRRLAAAARRAVSEGGLLVRAREYRGLSTDATPALARGYRAMSVMAFDINGRIPNWHWSTDVADNVSVDTIEVATDFVVRLIAEI